MTAVARLFPPLSLPRYSTMVNGFNFIMISDHPSADHPSASSPTRMRVECAYAEVVLFAAKLPLIMTQSNMGGARQASNCCREIQFFGSFLRVGKCLLIPSRVLSTRVAPASSSCLE